MLSDGSYAPVTKGRGPHTTEVRATLAIFVSLGGADLVFAGGVSGRFPCGVRSV
jgi:hypothetical protein